MRRLTERVLGLIHVLLILASPSIAWAGDWPTYEVLPLDTRTTWGQWFSSGVAPRDLGGNPVYASSRGMGETFLQSPDAFASITREVGWSLQQLDKAGYPQPAHMLVEDPDGLYWPALVVEGSNKLSTMQYALPCGSTEPRTLWNPFFWPPEKVNNPWNGPSPAWRKHRATTMIANTWVHEMVHAVQQSQRKCRDAPAWLQEGGADGVSYYLMGKRYPFIAKLFELAMNQRRWDVSLDLRQLEGQGELYRATAYGTGGFYRYLAEGTEKNGTDGLAILRPLITTHFGEPDHSKAVTLLDDTIQTHTSRRLYQVLPEFLTEYASYGGSRYKHSRKQESKQRYEVGEYAWLRSMFGGDCAKVDLKSLLSGAVKDQKVKLEVMAGQCLRVKWLGFDEPVGLTIEVKTATDPASLHIGEAWRRQNGEEHYCWDTTKELDQRVRKKAPEKCILGRDTTERGGDGTGAWRSDFALDTSGEAVFVVTNIAREPLETKAQTVTLRFAALVAKSKGKSLPPAKKASAKRVKGAPVQQGLSNLQEQVHAMYMGDGRRFFDGRSVLGGNRDFGFEGEGAEGAGVMIRSQDYMVVFMQPKSGSAAAAEMGANGSVIIKDPDSLGSMAGMMGLPSMVMSVGVDAGLPASCGYTQGVQTTVVGRQSNQLRLRLEADLFDMSKVSGEGCAGFASAWVERAVIELSVPAADLLDPDTAVVRTTPPGQELYDEEFVAGPMFGGIATSESLRTEGWPDMDALSAREGAGGGPPSMPSIPSLPVPIPQLPDDITEGLDIPETPEEVCEMLITNGMLANVDEATARLTMDGLKESNCLCALAKAAAAGRPGFSPAARQVLAERAAVDCP